MSWTGWKSGKCLKLVEAMICHFSPFILQIFHISRSFLSDPVLRSWAHFFPLLLLALIQQFLSKLMKSMIRTFFCVLWDPLPAFWKGDREPLKKRRVIFSYRFIVENLTTKIWKDKKKPFHRYRANYLKIQGKQNTRWSHQNIFRIFCVFYVENNNGWKYLHEDKAVCSNSAVFSTNVKIKI